MLSSSSRRARTALFLASICAATVALASLPVRWQVANPAAARATRRLVVTCCLLMLALIVFAGRVSAQSFSPPDSYSTGDNPIKAAVGDFNGDGKPDIAVTNTQSKTVSVLLNKGDGTFQTPVSYATDIWPVGIVTA